MFIIIAMCTCWERATNRPKVLHSATRSSLFLEAAGAPAASIPTSLQDTAHSLTAGRKAGGYPPPSYLFSTLCYVVLFIRGCLIALFACRLLYGVCKMKVVFAERYMHRWFMYSKPYFSDQYIHVHDKHSTLFMCTPDVYMYIIIPYRD